MCATNCLKVARYQCLYLVLINLLGWCQNLPDSPNFSTAIKIIYCRRAPVFETNIYFYTIVGRTGFLKTPELSFNYIDKSFSKSLPVKLFLRKAPRPKPHFFTALWVISKADECIGKRRDIARTSNYTTIVALY